MRDEMWPFGCVNQPKTVPVPYMKNKWTDTILYPPISLLTYVNKLASCAPEGTKGTPESAKQPHVPLVVSPWNGTQVRINPAFYAGFPSRKVQKVRHMS